MGAWRGRFEVENIPVYSEDPVKAAQEHWHARKQSAVRRGLEQKARKSLAINNSQATPRFRGKGLGPRTGRTIAEALHEESASDREPVLPWCTVLPTVVPGAEKIEIQRKDACDSMRMIVFGRIGTENKFIDKDKMYYEQMGTKEHVLRLWSMWIEVDEAECGEISFVEFCKHIPKTRTDRHGLAEKVMKLLTAIKRPSVTLSDFLRIMWPGSRDEHLKQMKSWLQDFERRRLRVPTPPLLSDDQRDGLAENFRVYDKKQHGAVSITELIMAGLITEEMHALFREFDTDNNGMLDAEEFPQMLCPCGYRAERGSRACFDEEGQRLILDDSDPEFPFWKRFDIETSQRDLDGWIHPALRTNESDRRVIRGSKDSRRPSVVPSSKDSRRPSVVG